MKQFLLTTIFTLFFLNAFSQRIVELREVIYFNAKGKVSEGAVVYMLPESIPGKQSIMSIDYSKKPTVIYKKDNALFADWSFLDFNKNDSVVITIKVMLNRYDFYTATRMQKQFVKRNLRKSSREKYMEKNLAPFLIQKENTMEFKTELESMAAKLQADDKLRTTENIFNFVVDHLNYQLGGREKNKIKRAIKRKKGDCTEYSELMVALCRINNIPARVITGNTILPDQSIGAHNWVEVFLPEFGWVPFDPTHADGESRNTTFHKMENKYIYYAFQQHKYIIGWGYGENRKQNIKLDIEHQWTDLLEPGLERAYQFYNESTDEKAAFVLDSLINVATLDYRLYMLKGMLFARAGDFKLALSNLQFAMKNAYFPIEKGNVVYAFSNYYALQNKTDAAMAHLGRAMELGFCNLKHIRHDKDLDSIKDLDAFVDLMNKNQLNYLLFSKLYPDLKNP